MEIGGQEYYLPQFICSKWCKGWDRGAGSEVNKVLWRSLVCKNLILFLSILIRNKFEWSKGIFVTTWSHYILFISSLQWAYFVFLDNTRTEVEQCKPANSVVSKPLSRLSCCMYCWGRLYLTMNMNSRIFAHCRTTIQYGRGTEQWDKVQDW